MTDSAGTAGQLEQEILRLLEAGIVVSKNTLFFAESTWGLGPGELESALTDSQFEERVALLALILTPSTNMRQALEPLLAQMSVDKLDTRGLIQEVHDKTAALPIRIDGEPDFTITAGLADIEYFISKLYLDRSIDEQIATVLSEQFSEETVIGARLLLRCRGDAFFPAAREFIIRFIRKSRSYEAEFVELFAIVVKTLADVPEGGSIENYFLSRKLQLIKSLKDKRAFEQKRDHYSMEYLMMQRYPVDPESEEMILSKLLHLATITDAILKLPSDPLIAGDLESHDFSGHGTAVKKTVRIIS